MRFGDAVIGLTVAGLVAGNTVSGGVGATSAASAPLTIASNTVLYQAPEEPVTITEIPLELSDDVIATLDTTIPEAPVGVVPDVLTAAPPAAMEPTDEDRPVALDTVDAAERAAGPVIEPAEEFQSVALTWPTDVANVPELQARVRTVDGEWGEWFHLEDDGAVPDPGSPDAQMQVRAGSALVFVGSADAVQVATVGRADEALASDDVQLTLVAAPEPVAVAQGPVAALDVDPTAAQTVPVVAEAGVVARFSAAASGRPSMVTRAQWGAAPATCSLSAAPRLRGAVVHHTAGSNNYTTQAQVMQQIRGAQSYHQTARGWCDIGYNLLVDRFGTLYEGRSGSMDRAVVGVHATGFNTGFLGLALVGNFDQIALPAAAADAAGRAIGYRLGQDGVNPQATASFQITIAGTRYPVGSVQTLPVVMGHRQVATTACPGRFVSPAPGVSGTDLMPTIRRAAATVGAQDCNFVTDSFAPGPAERTFSFGCGQDVVVGDWDGDGVDTLAIRDGATFRFTNDPQGRTVDITLVYGRPADEVAVGDWNGDGRDTLAVRRGNTFFVMNELRSGAADVVFDYGRVGDEVFVGDWDGDARDTFAVRRGRTFFFTNVLRGGRADHEQVYGRSGDVVHSGNWTGTGGDTLLVRRGNEFHFRHDLTSGPAHVVQHFGRATDRIVIGDWNGDRIDTVMVRR